MVDATERSEAEATGLTVPQPLRTDAPATAEKPADAVSPEERALMEKRSGEAERTATRLETLSDLRLRLGMQPAAPHPALPHIQNVPRPPQDDFRGFAAIAPMAIFMAFAGSKMSGGNAMAALDAATGFINGFQEGDKARIAQNRSKWEDSLKALKEQNAVEQHRYNNVLNDRALTEQEKQTKMAALAHAFDDQVVASKFRIGDYDGAIKTIGDRNKVMEGMANKLKIAQLRGSLQPMQRMLFEKKVQEFKDSNDGREPNAGEVEQMVKDVTAASHVQPRVRQLAPVNQEIQRRTKENIDNGMEPGEAFRQASQSTRRDMAVPPASQLTQLQNRADMITYSVDALNQAEALMAKRSGLPGLGGKIRRPLESASNVAGMSGTDARQFERLISELQEWAPQILAYRAGRPLASEAGKINAIVPGLRAGDTTANTKRQFQQLRELYGAMHKQTLDQLGGNWQPQEPSPPGGRGGGVPAGPQPRSRPSYEEAPVAE